MNNPMNAEPACPDEHTLLSLIQGRLEAAAAIQVRDHLATCTECRARADRLRLAGSPGAAGHGSATMDDRITIDADPPREVHSREESESLEDLAFLLPSDNPKALGRIGDHDILHVLGRGGMGIVLKAFDTSLHRTVAIKVLSPQLASSRKAHRRFLREARAAAGINHPNVVTIHAVDEQGGMPFLVMEYVPGRTLRQRLRLQPALDRASIVRISTQIAAGLAAAHQQGVIHRDIKPANIMLEDGIERVKITDFGLALVTQDITEITSADRVVGTPAYMSPEQVGGQRVDARSDLFSLGCVMYAMVAGRSPFHGSHSLEVARKVADLNPPPLGQVDPTVPKFYADLVGRLLAKDPAHRPQTAAEVQDMLQSHLAEVRQDSSVVHQPVAAERRSFWNRSRGSVAAGVLLLMVLACLAALHFWPRGDQDNSPGAPPAGDRAGAAKTLTVAGSGAADYRSLKEALAHARPGSTIQVLDGATYAEALLLDDPGKLRGVTVEARKQATLAPPAGAMAAVTIRNTPGVTFRGLRIRVGVNQHALMILGEAAGVTIEDVTCIQPRESQWANVYITGNAHGQAGRPIRVRRSAFQSGLMGIVLEGGDNGPVSFVRVENNRFAGPGTHVLLNRAVAEVHVQGNLFLDHGVTISLGGPGPSRNLRLVNNTFYRAPRWLILSGMELAQDVVVVNNLVLGADGMEVTGALEEVARRWSFRHNWWEPGERTDLRQARLVAKVRSRIELLSRVPASPNFLRPPAASPLADAGAGGEFPRYVGALPPAADAK